MNRRLPLASGVLLLTLLGLCRDLVGASTPPAPAIPAQPPTEIATPLPIPQPTWTYTPVPYQLLVWPQDNAPMVLVPAGQFMMGLDNPPNPGENSNEIPAHFANVDALWIDRFEVTNQRYAQFMLAGGYTTRQYWTNNGWQWLSSQQTLAPDLWERADFGLPDQPVVGVSWHEAYAYCLWSGKRLPTEAEWEKAARGTDGRLYPWGNEWDCSRGNFDDELSISPGANECSGRDQHALPAPVGSYEVGQSPYYIHDMAGNVWEWTLSAAGPYPYIANDGRNQVEQPDPRVIRGASWFTYTGSGTETDDNHARVTFRAELDPATRSNTTGFRCVAPAQ